jgi:hypothetical protein
LLHSEQDVFGARASGKKKARHASVSCHVGLYGLWRHATSLSPVTVDSVPVAGLNDEVRPAGNRKN